MTRTSQRDLLITEHVEVARRISLRFARRCPGWVQRDDLLGAALLGLTEAAQRYDATRGEPFLSYAEKRIRGAVQDELRRGDILPRRVRQRSRKVAAVIAEHERVSGTRPTDAVVAERLGVSVEDVKRDEQLGSIAVVSLVDDARPAESETPETMAAHRLVMAKVQLAIAGLDARDSELLACHYARELSYGETGKRLGVTTSRVCQLHGRMIERLRSALGETVTAAAA
jgi:RNA polymerase sigma factor for flagellar operon FliA